MTSIHMNNGESQATTPTSTINGTTNNQIQFSSSRYDDEERQHQRFNELRRRHEEASKIHQNTQPKLDEQTQEETLKIIKSGQVNGTKTKIQKPRAPKRQRTTTASSNNSANTNISTNINSNNVLNQGQIHASSKAIGTNNGVQHQQATLPQQPNMVPPHLPQQHIMQQQALSQTQEGMSAGVQSMQQISSYSPHMQQPMHIQRQQQPQQQQPNQINQNHSYNDTYNQNQYQSPPIYSQRPQMPPTSHSAQTMQQPMNQNHLYMNHQSYARQDHQSYYQSQPIMNNNISVNHNHHLYYTLPNDLDLNIEAGLECDIDSLIKHEVSIEGQLNFNPDLLDRLVDDYYHHQPNHH